MKLRSHLAIAFATALMPALCLAEKPYASSEGVPWKRAPESYLGAEFVEVVASEIKKLESAA